MPVVSKMGITFFLVEPLESIDLAEVKNRLIASLVALRQTAALSPVS